ncbi:response regulator transcription factor [Occultella glacieicola]|uniref:Response regulator transcription factor n=1 Tax=Occultella glacieicola TaxID=2518684 RepID=A0ABY2E4D7_9MICO|nr:response regulator transcription factor [Occultella glacieicola]TDE92708.1 response regulator transcription factor [Occultella glacieicola]
MTIRVAIVDDQALVRSGFAMVLSVEDDIEVVGQASDGARAVELLAATPADVVLMDVQMPVLDGIAATERIVAAGGPKVIILTTFDREDYLFAALRAGASGFLLKNADPDDLVAAIRAVADGHALLSPEVTVKVIARLAAEPAPSGTPARTTGPTGPTGPSEGGSSENGARCRQATSTTVSAHAVESLTARERDVLALLAEGHSNAEIASELFVGESTVKTHVSHVLAKIGARDRVQAVVFAHRAGLVGHHD